jgi:hypothetical protein
MTTLSMIDFSDLYANFHQPITGIDCGQKCAPFNQHAVPFCCDIRHAVPSAYHLEWEYLLMHTDLWHLWHAPEEHETARLHAQCPQGQVLIECKGYLYCQRSYRSLTCRAFPFFPYITPQGKFIGLSYYWEYKDRCWVISHLDQVSHHYVSEFVAAFETIFRAYPEEKEAFRYHSGIMRRRFSRHKRAIPLLHLNGRAYKITPKNGRLRKIPLQSLPKFGPYHISSELLFPDEAA